MARNDKESCNDKESRNDKESCNDKGTRNDDAGRNDNAAVALRLELVQGRAVAVVLQPLNIGVSGQVLLGCTG